MVLQGSVDHPALVVPAPPLLVLSEEALLIPWRRPFWDGCRSSSVRQADKGGVGDMIVLLGRKEKIKVAVFTSAKVVLDQRRVCHQELMALLYGRVVGLASVPGG